MAGDAALAMIARTPSLASYQLLALDWAAVDHPGGRSLRAGARALRSRGAHARCGARCVVSPQSHGGARVARGRGHRHQSTATSARRSRRRRRSSARPGHALLPALGARHRRARGREPTASSPPVCAPTPNASSDIWTTRPDRSTPGAPILAEKRSETDRSEIAREQMLAEAQLALNAGQRRDLPAARAWLAKALAQSDELRARGGRAATDGAGAIDAATPPRPRGARRRVAGGGADRRARLPARRRSAQAASRPSRPQLAAHHDPLFRSYAGWFEIYGPLVK